MEESGVKESITGCHGNTYNPHQGGWCKRVPNLRWWRRRRRRRRKGEGREGKERWGRSREAEREKNTNKISHFSRSLGLQCNPLGSSQDNLSLNFPLSFFKQCIFSSLIWTLQFTLDLYIPELLQSERERRSKSTWVHCPIATHICEKPDGSWKGKETVTEQTRYSMPTSFTWKQDPMRCTNSKALLSRRSTKSQQ